MSVTDDGKRWINVGDVADRKADTHYPSPPWVEAFLDDIEAVCKKHGLSIGHEDGHGGFEIEPFEAYYVAWLRSASLNVPSLTWTPRLTRPDSAMRRVVVTFDVDPKEYEGAVDTEEGAVDLAIAMLRCDADLPGIMTVQCGSVERTTMANDSEEGIDPDFKLVPSDACDRCGVSKESATLHTDTFSDGGTTRSRTLCEACGGTP